MEHDACILFWDHLFISCLGRHGPEDVCCVCLFILNEWMVEFLHFHSMHTCVVVIHFFPAASLDEKKKFHSQILWISSLLGLSRAIRSTEVHLGARQELVS